MTRSAGTYSITAVRPTMSARPGPAKTVVSACGCLDDFPEAVAMMQTVRLAGADLVCTGGTTLMRRWLLPLLALSLTAAPAQADPLCAADLNGNGDAADPGETSACTATSGANWQCPLQAVVVHHRSNRHLRLPARRPICLRNACERRHTRPARRMPVPIARQAGSSTSRSSMTRAHPPMAPWTRAANAPARSRSSRGARSAAVRRA